jgi:hypothetical protein
MDSGAEVDLLRLETAERLKLQTQKLNTPRILEGAGGQRFEASHIYKGPLQLDGASAPIYVELLCSDVHFDVFLGINFFRRFNPSVNWETGRMDVCLSHDTAGMCQLSPVASSQ